MLVLLTITVAPGEMPTVPQRQKSKGSLIMTTALELCSNRFLTSTVRARTLEKCFVCDAITKGDVAGPLVALAPLPAGAQFLNVIESVFSGMARAVIANSNYASVEEARAAIETYVRERNEKFTFLRVK